MKLLRKLVILTIFVVASCYPNFGHDSDPIVRFDPDLLIISNLTIDSLSNTSVHLKWNVTSSADCNGTVLYRIDFGSKFDLMEPASAITTELKLSGLKENVKYGFIIAGLCFSEVELSSFFMGRPTTARFRTRDPSTTPTPPPVTSGALTARLDPDFPIPSYLKPEISSDTVLLKWSWTPPANCTGAVQYDILIGSKFDDLQGDMNWSKTEWKVTGLRGDTKYGIIIQPQCSSHGITYRGLPLIETLKTDASPTTTTPTSTTTQAPDPPHPFPTWAIVLIVLSVVGVITAGGCYYWFRVRS